MRKIIALFLITAFLSACNEKDEQNMQHVDLSEDWSFRKEGSKDRYPALIPGTVHTDLLANGLIPDPYLKTNEDSVQWIENEDWIYTRTFRAGASLLEHENIELVFEGLDTYADVYLNDSLIIRADNMFLAWERSCKNLLKEGENELKVHFHSAVEEGMRKLKQLDYTLFATNEQAPEGEKTNIFTRKAPFHYGWDWGPRLVTAGIWRPVYLRAWNEVIIRDVYLQQRSFDKNHAGYTAFISVESEESGLFNFKVTADGEEMYNGEKNLEKGVNEVNIPVNFENPELWWSNGLGDQKLYNVEVRIEKGGKTYDRESTRLGVRKLELVQESDSIGRSFYFRLNGIPVFMKGANYIPGDVFIPMVTEEKYEALVEDAVAANMNMLRVWGGAIYENDIFYDLCDKNGILVWQDFMFACALQPGDSAHLENIRKEAVYNVKRLRNHPSLALWCGNNENLIAWHNWGWKDAYSEEVSNFLWETYENIFYEILDDAVKENDPERSYWPSSPQAYGDKLADRKSGDEHDWTIWFGEKPYEDYGKDVARFVSEYGLQSFPELQTVDYFSEKEDQYMFSPLLDRRQRSKMNWVEPGFNGNDMQLKYIKRYFPEPAGFEEFVYLSQVNHQLSMQEAIEAHRRNMPRCMGSLYWQINDCWPTISWASVDYFGNWKAPHYQAKRSFEKVIIAPEKTARGIRLFIVSDSTSAIDGELQLEWIKTDGKIYGEPFTAKVTAKPNTSTAVHELSYADSDVPQSPEDYILFARFLKNDRSLAENIILPLRPKHMNIEPVDIEITADKEGDGYKLRLNSEKPALYVYLNLENGRGKFSDNYFHMAPGKTKVIHLQTTEEVKDPAKEISVRSLNQL